jgi:hypothetical protein
MQDALARAAKADSAQNLHTAGLAYPLANDTKESRRREGGGEGARGWNPSDLLPRTRRAP